MAGAIRTYRDLIVWQRAFELGLQIHRASKRFPRDEQWGLTSQVRRSSTSVPYNIAEGFGQGSKDAYLRHLRIARGSLFECENQLMYAREFGYLTDAQFQELHAVWQEVDRLLSALLRSLNR